MVLALEPSSWREPHSLCELGDRRHKLHNPIEMFLKGELAKHL